MCNLAEAGGNISSFSSLLGEEVKIKNLKGRALGQKSKSLYEKLRKGSKFLFGAGNGI